jgi:hypothetical protein
MHPELARLLAELTDEAATLLASCGEKKWSEWLRTDAQRIRNLDLCGFKHLMSAFDGTESINDLVLHPQSGNNTGDDQITPVNEKLSFLLSKISWLVKTLYVDEIVAQHMGNFTNE